MKNVFRWFTRKKPVEPDTYLDDLAKAQQDAWTKFAALAFDDPAKTIAWWEYRFAQNRRSNAIVTEWYRVKR